MINGGYPETPDAWIERNEDDPDDRYFKGDGEPDEIFSATCTSCELPSNPDEMDALGLCPNCHEEKGLHLWTTKKEKQP